MDKHMKKRLISLLIILGTVLNSGFLVFADEAEEQDPEIEIEVSETDITVEEEVEEEELIFEEPEADEEIIADQIEDVFEVEDAVEEEPVTEDQNLVEVYSFTEYYDEEGVPVAEDITVEYVDESEVLPSNNAFSTMEEAGYYIRQCIKNRDEEIIFSVDPANQPIKSLYTDASREITRFTGVPDEGDYNILMFNSKEWSYCKLDGRYEVTLKPVYRTTREQEITLSDEIDNVLDELDIAGKSDYEKVCAIYDYICENIKYDYDHLEDESYKLKYTAYAALINKTAVCGGYAQLFYRMAAEAGVDVRYCDGDTSRGFHAWNLVILDGKAYYLDSTWDAGKDPSNYRYFLKGKTEFEGTHILDEDCSDYYDLYTFSELDYGVDPNFVLDAMGNIKIEYLSGNKVRISWVKNSDSNITGYNVYISKNGNDSYKLNYTTTSTGLTYTLDPDTKYYFKIQPYGIDANGKTRTGDMSPYFLICTGGGWQKDAKGFWYRYSDGTYATGWKKLDGKWYYFKTSGYMATGWQQVSGKWYIFDQNGVMQTGWKNVNDKWYWFETSGRMVTGWKQISGKWYYFNPDGDMRCGWLKYKGSWYYLGSNGRMLESTSITLNGKTYYFDRSGICTNP